MDRSELTTVSRARSVVTHDKDAPPRYDEVRGRLSSFTLACVVSAKHHQIANARLRLVENISVDMVANRFKTLDGYAFAFEGLAVDFDDIAVNQITITRNGNHSFDKDLTAHYLGHANDCPRECLITGLYSHAAKRFP